MLSRCGTRPRPAQKADQHDRHPLERRCSSFLRHPVQPDVCGYTVACAPASVPQPLSNFASCSAYSHAGKPCAAMIIHGSVHTTSHVVKQIGEQGPAREATTRDFVVACICGRARPVTLRGWGSRRCASSVSASQRQATALGYSCREVEKQECNYAEAAMTFWERATGGRAMPPLLFHTYMHATAEKKRKKFGEIVIVIQHRRALALRERERVCVCGLFKRDTEHLFQRPPTHALTRLTSMRPLTSSMLVPPSSNFR